MSFSYREKVEQAVHFIKARITDKPDVIILLGTGLGNLVAQVTDTSVLPYELIPHFRKTTIRSHQGNVVFGKLAGQKVAILQGRLHYYEGYSTQEITFPIRVLSQLGCTSLMVSNAAGGLNPQFKAGSLMTITDHINFISDNPLRGENYDEWGPRFPDLSNTYDKELIKFALEAAQEEDVPVVKGIYACVPGPSLETPAETKFYRNCGADAIGMSTVPEVIVAKHGGLRIFGLSVLANINDPENFQPIFLDDVLQQVKKGEAHFQKIILSVLQKMKPSL